VVVTFLLGSGPPSARSFTVAPAARFTLDVDDPAFLHPADMPAAINGQLARTGQKTMHDPVELVRAIFEGLALKYKVALERAEQLSGTRVRVIHVVGGGARNELLCQLTANACGRSVAAGPAEATALGNVLVQAMGRGEVKTLAEAHAIARSSADVRVHEPHGSSDWDKRHARLVSPG